MNRTINYFSLTWTFWFLLSELHENGWYSLFSVVAFPSHRFHSPIDSPPELPLNPMSRSSGAPPSLNCRLAAVRRYHHQAQPTSAPLDVRHTTFSKKPDSFRPPLFLSVDTQEMTSPLSANSHHLGWMYCDQRLTRSHNPASRRL